MRKPSNALVASLAAMALTAAVSFGTPALADGPDPTVHQIYEAAEAGHFDQAQQLMDQVLKDHPTSSKAHYVQAELYAKEGKTALARSELAQAEKIDPGLTHENPRAVLELKTQLGLVHVTQGPHIISSTGAPAGAGGTHWGLVLIVVLAIAALFMLFRRRNTYPQQYPGGAVMGGGPGTYGGPAGGFGGGAAPMGGGIGGSVAGGLASGLAVGAGVVAGEELAHHFLDGRSEGTVVPPNNNGDWQQSSNSDMGGTDFGVNDAGSWDDSSGGGGGGDDWS